MSIKTDKSTDSVGAIMSTIAKIKGSTPVLGGKWKAGMLLYYTSRLQEMIDAHLPALPGSPEMEDFAEVLALHLVDTIGDQCTNEECELLHYNGNGLLYVVNGDEAFFTDVQRPGS